MPTSYCVVNDIPVQVRENMGRGANVQEEIYNVAELIDSKLGERYVLPLALSAENPAHVPYLLALKRFNAYGVIGHLVTRAALGAEDTDLIPYGKWHLRKLDEFLERICDGRFRIPNQQMVKMSGEEYVRGPIAFGPDVTSRVEPFYAGGNERPWLGSVSS